MAAEKKNQLLKGDISEIIGKGKLKNLFAPVDISSLVVFRIFFGLVMFIEIYRFFDKGWIKRYWITPEHHFTYWPLDFLQPLPGDGMYILFACMLLFSLGITFGLFYRYSCFLFSLFYTYSFLIESTRYLNHFYLICLMSFVLAFIPAHHSFSLDAKFFKKIRSETAPSWTLWLARFMVGIPYFFGGIAKLNSDWLMGQPMRIWLRNDTNFPVIGQYFTEDWMVFIFSYSGLLLDLLVVPMLLFKPTRKWAYIGLIIFNLLNTQLFTIGIFPWLMLCSATIYLSPDWPRKLIQRFKGKKFWPMVLPKDTSPPSSFNAKQKLVLALLAFWITLHTLVPFRHLVLPGQVHWSEDGYKFSWHMMLRSKTSRTAFSIQDKKTGLKEAVRLGDYFPKWQIFKIEHTPDLIWQASQIIKNEYAKKGMDVAVYADIQCSLNGRKFQQLTKPDVDITSVPRPVASAPDWIIPLQVALNESKDEQGDIDDDVE